MKKIPIITLSTLALLSTGVFAQSADTASKPAPRIDSTRPIIAKLPGNHTLIINIKTNQDNQVSIVTSDGKIISEFEEPGELEAITTQIEATITMNEQKSYDISYRINSRIPRKSGKDSITYSSIGTKANVTLALGNPVIVYQASNRTYTLEIIKTPATAS